MPDVIVCAHNEAPRIAPVLDAITQSQYVSNLFVVADRCTDGTENIARRYTPHVISSTANDKGTAMSIGLRYVVTDSVLFIDADLGGLTSGHIDALATIAPSDGQVVGLVTPAWLRWDGYLRVTGRLPSISGQRRLPTELARSVPLQGAGWQAETMLNVTVAKARIPHRQVILRGVTNPTTAVFDPIGWLLKAGHVLETSVVYAPELARYVAS